MSDFITRLEQEQKELQIKIDALESFINDKDKFVKIGVVQNILLKNQLSIMISYNEILIVRLALLKN
jgi:hypothetical protein